MALFREFIDVFAWSYKDLRGFDPCVIQHSIPLEEGVVPIRQRQCHVNPKLDALIRKELDKMLDVNIIFPVWYSKWVANLVPIWKKNGDIRLCIDFHDLNWVSVKDNFPLPFMDSILQQVTGSEMMSLLDGFSGYNQVFINPRDRYKTTFTMRWGTYMYHRMPFGLINASTTFQRMMHISFDDLIGVII